MLLDQFGSPIVQDFGSTLKHELYAYTEGTDQAADEALAKFVMEELQKHYPGHPWWVQAEAATGAVVVRLNYLNRMGRGSPFGFVVHIDRLKTHDGFKEIMRAGGELLERRDLMRGPAMSDARWRAKDNTFDTATG